MISHIFYLLFITHWIFQSIYIVIHMKMAIDGIYHGGLKQTGFSDFNGTYLSASYLRIR